MKLCTAKSSCLAIAAMLCVSGFPLHADTLADLDIQHYKNAYGLPTGYTAQMLTQALGEHEAALIRDIWHLTPGWTESDYCAAHVQSREKEFREKFNLKPDFSEADFKKNAGALGLNQRIDIYNLPPQFTEAQLEHALGVYEASAIAFEFQDLPHAFSAQDYKRAAGLRAMQSLALTYDLRNAFTYADLAAQAGPLKTTEVRHQYNFSRGATHDEMENQAGAYLTAQFAEKHGLSRDFTSTELVEKLGKERLEDKRTDLKDFLPRGAALTSENLAIAYGNQEASYVHAGVEDSGYFGTTIIQGPINEANVAAAAQKDCLDLRSEYGLSPGFSERDYAAVFGASEVADLRHRFHLPSDFTEGQLLDAIRLQD